MEHRLSKQIRVGKQKPQKSPFSNINFSLKSTENKDRTKELLRNQGTYLIVLSYSGLCTTDDVADALANAAYLCMKHKKTSRPGDFIFI